MWWIILAFVVGFIAGIVVFAHFYTDEEDHIQIGFIRRESEGPSAKKGEKK